MLAWYGTSNVSNRECPLPGAEIAIAKDVPIW